MEIPPKIAIPICIEQGSIYHCHLNKKNSDGTVYDGNRFFIVLNVNPKTDEVLVFSTITTKIDKTKKFIKSVGEDPETLVNITKSDFSHLSQDSVVNCNNYYQMSLRDLIEKIEMGGKSFSCKLSRTIISALVRGMMKSNQIPTEIKEMLI